LEEVISYHRAMDLYDAERWALERHAEMIRAAESRARLRPASRRAPIRSGLADGLRLLADRIDRRPSVDPELYISKLPS
jgi:hypothetical protein